MPSMIYPLPSSPNLLRALLPCLPFSNHESLVQSSEDLYPFLPQALCMCRSSQFVCSPSHHCFCIANAPTSIDSSFTVLLLLSCIQLFANSWIIPLQAPPSMEFSRKEYWSRLSFPTPEDLPDLRIEPTFLVSPALASRFFTTRHLESPSFIEHAYNCN